MRYHLLLGACFMPLVLGQDSTDRCYTRMDSTSHEGAVPTVSKNYYTPCTVTTTKTVTKTSTAKTKVTSTSIVTSTVQTVTTVPTSAGFSPIQDTIPSASYDGADGGASKRGLPATRKRNLARKSATSSAYPSAVTCWHWTHSQCSTSTQQATYTAVVSGKNLPTTTVTSTATTTSYTSTAYAACQTNNFADYATVSGQTCYFNGYNDTLPDYSYDVSLSTLSAYECCVFALTDPHQAMFWEYEADAYNGLNECVAFVTDGTCPAQDNNEAQLVCTYTQPPGTERVLAGNSYCGEWGSLAVDGYGF